MNPETHLKLALTYIADIERELPFDPLQRNLKARTSDREEMRLKLVEARTVLAALEHDAPGTETLFEVKKGKELLFSLTDARILCHIVEGKLMATLYGDPPTAVQCMQRAVAIDPENDQTHSWLALMLLQAGDLRGAKEAVDRAISLNPGDTSHLDLRAHIMAPRAPVDQKPSYPWWHVKRYV